MGYAFHELVPPAILLDSPGQTKQEFVDLLDNTHASSGAIDPSTSWEYHDQQNEGIHYEHQGLRGLANILNLRCTEGYKQFQKELKFSNGISLQAPDLHIYIDPDNPGQLRYDVRVHKENLTDRKKVVEMRSWYALKRGDIVSLGEEESQKGFEEGIVSTVLEEELADSRITKVEIVPFQQVRETEAYSSEEELFWRWPQFGAELMYDFSQPQGHFSVDMSPNNFRWINKNGRYYLDPETYNLIPASFFSGLRNRQYEDGFGYTDLILTAEAIRHNAWKLLSRRGLDHLEDFLKDFPAAKQRYEKAVWDSHTSLAAKSKGMTNTQLLTMRLAGWI